MGPDKNFIYSKPAFLAGWGKRYRRFCCLAPALILVPILIMALWDLLPLGHTPALMESLSGLWFVLTVVVAIPGSIALYVARKGRGKGQQVTIADGVLYVVLPVQAGWTASFAGFVYESMEYTVARVDSFFEDGRHFVVQGDVIRVHCYQGMTKPPEHIDSLKIPKVFEDQDVLRDYLNREMRGA